MIAALLIASWVCAQPPDAGTPPAAEEVARLRADVQSLRDRVTQLERDLADSRQRNAELKQLVSQLEAIHSDLRAAIADRRRAETETQQRAEAAQTALNNLIALDARLATGDDDVLPVLDAAARALPTNAASDLFFARRALANKDLANARLLVLQAIADAELAH